MSASSIDAHLAGLQATQPNAMIGEVVAGEENSPTQCFREHLGEAADKMVAELPDRLRSFLMQMAAKVQEDGSRKPETA